MTMKLYPSKLAFCKGETLTCEYNSQCQRYQIFMGDRRDEIDGKYQLLGAEWENEVENRLKKQGIEYKKELPVKLNVFDDVQISGRLDYLAGDVILECKGSLSKKFLTDVIKGGKVKLSHLAQVSAYYILMSLNKAKLLTGYYHIVDEKPVLHSERAFKVFLDDTGDILINRTPSGFKLDDLLRGIKLVSEAVKNKDLMLRPEGAYSWMSVCKFCKFNSICSEVDLGMGHAEAIEIAKEMEV